MKSQSDCCCCCSQKRVFWETHWLNLNLNKNKNKNKILTQNLAKTDNFHYLLSSGRRFFHPVTYTKMQNSVCQSIEHLDQADRVKFSWIRFLPTGAHRFSSLAGGFETKTLNRSKITSPDCSRLGPGPDVVVFLFPAALFSSSSFRLFGPVLLVFLLLPLIDLLLQLHSWKKSYLVRKKYSKWSLVKVSRHRETSENRARKKVCQIRQVFSRLLLPSILEKEEKRKKFDWNGFKKRKEKMWKKNFLLFE